MSQLAKTRHSREELLQEAMDMYAVTEERLAELRGLATESAESTRELVRELSDIAIIALHRAMVATQDAEAIVRCAVLAARKPIQEIEHLLGVPAMEDEE